MPELPEVETLRQDLSREVVGRKVKAVSVANGRSVRRHPSAKHFRALLEGRTIKSVGRLGKYLLLTLDSGDTLVVHLGMSGQLLRVKSVKDAKPKHTHVVITFTQGGELRYLYSDEMLYQAGLRYDRPADSLTATEVRRLYRAIVETLADAIKHRGSSLADEQYRDLFGEIGDFQGSHQVYDREGQPCRRCRNNIVRVKAGGRSTFFCEHCQV